MITQEMVQATMQERMADFDHQAQLSRKKKAETRSRPSKPSWFRMPSFVMHARRPASSR